ncbi:MAG: CHASE2 domain-containing protein [Gammaproteobacteria bacterium]|nr:CHASE2 domain-containing protein [Gammaproteobacteria bacterium]
MSERRIFISYRRQGGIDSARALYQQIKAFQPDWELFLDGENIWLGEQWQQKLAAELARADTLLVIIGPDWLELADAEGRRRLDDPLDVTRWEIVQGLGNAQTTVIPVSVGGAEFPRESELPEALKPLAGRQGIRIHPDPSSYGSDVENLIARIQRRTLRDSFRRFTDRNALERARRVATPLLTALLFSLMWVGLLDLMALDTRASIWSFALSEMVAPQALDEEITLVAIPATFDTRAPDARHRYAQLIDILSAAGARRILLDLYFETPQPAADAVLAAALAKAAERHTEVFFGFDETIEGAPRTVPDLAQHADGLGLLCAGGRLDYTQVMPVVFDYTPPTETVQAGISPLPALALLGAFGPLSVRYLNQEAMSLELQGASETFRPAISMLDPIVRPHKGCKSLRMGTQAGLIFLRLSPLEQMRAAAHRLMLTDLLSGAIPDSRIAGRIFIVGHESREEIFQVAYRMQIEERFGYELHADAINTLRNERIARPLPLSGEFVLLLLGVAVGGWLGVRLHDRSALLRWMVVPAAALLTLGAGVLSLALFDLIHQFAYTLFALLLSYALFIHAARKRLGRS